MKQQFLFNSSLPRSGATVFQNIIAQNPDFFVIPRSGFFDLIFGARSSYQNTPEFRIGEQKTNDNAFLAFCKEGMRGYYATLTAKPFVLDNHPAWGAGLLFAGQFVDNPKVVCIVRDLRAVFASMEKQFRQMPLHNSNVQNAAALAGTTLSKRIAIWAASPPLGLALDRLRDMIDQNIDDKILFIRYEDLCANPDIELTRFYQYCGIEPYKSHDFKKISQQGMGYTRPELEMQAKDYEDVLGFEICQQIKNSYPWFFNKFTYL